MKALLLAACLASLGPASSWAAAVADKTADVSVAMPSFAPGRGPLVAIDAGHANFHTISGRFAPFAQLLMNDGFRVREHAGPFTEGALADISVLVIANALHPSNVERWTLPTPSAFTAEEIMAVRSFVEKGGALLLIADHMPFAGAASGLGTVFGISYVNGFVFRVPEARPVDIFSRADGTLGDDPLTKGLRRVATFTGSALRAPANARRLLVLTADYEAVLPTTAWQFTEGLPHGSAAGLVQGAALDVGRGRLAAFGEAAMFTAQVEDSDPTARTGFGAPGAEDNKTFVLNVVRWLAGRN